jgi:hypothetical protein
VKEDLSPARLKNIKTKMIQALSLEQGFNLFELEEHSLSPAVELRQKLLKIPLDPAHRCCCFVFFEA